MRRQKHYILHAHMSKTCLTSKRHIHHEAQEKGNLHTPHLSKVAFLLPSGFCHMSRFFVNKSLNCLIHFLIHFTCVNRNVILIIKGTSNKESWGIALCNLK